MILRTLAALFHLDELTGIGKLTRGRSGRADFGSLIASGKVSDDGYGYFIFCRSPYEEDC